MNDSNRDYDNRQFRLMQRIIEQYRDGSVNLGQVVDGLESLSAALREPTEEWLSEFGQAWGALEDVYAFMRTERPSQLDQQSLGLIAGSIGRLESLLRKYVDIGLVG